MTASTPASLPPDARVAIIGGGPGGLFLATLLRKARPDWEVVVHERNPRGATYGFGVVFTVQTVRGLYEADPGAIDEVASAFQSWTDIEIGLPSGVARTGGHHFSAVERRRLMEILARHAEESGADLRYEVDVDDVDLIHAGADLLVAADGVNSRVRGRWADEFGPSIHTGSAVFAWFATPRRYDALTFHFVQTEYGAFATHAYPFSDELSTFIVETDEATWRRAGLDVLEHDPPPPGRNDEVGLAFCQEIFADSLRGHELVGNNSRWLRFPTVRNRSWSAAGNVVILGDAAHTAHFSVGSGTKMAMEDAAALAAALTGEPSLPAALARYDEVRRPQVARIQDAAEPSRGWWESFGGQVDRDLTTFSINFLTRTGRELLDSLHKRDPAFAEERTRADVLSDRVRIADIEVPNRLAVVADRALLDAVATGTYDDPAGLVLVDEPLAADLGGDLAAVVAAIEDTGAVVALEAGDSATLAFADAAAIGSDPFARPTVATLDVPAEAGDHEGHRAACSNARALVERGAVALWLRPTPDAERGRDGLIVACDRVRAVVDVPLLVTGASSTLDAATLTSAGRADVCVADPGVLGLRWAV